MGKKFKGEERIKFHNGQPVRVRVYFTPEDKLEKVVLIHNGRNVVLEPGILAIAGQLADELKYPIQTSAPGFVASDPLAELVRKHVLPYTVSKRSDRGEFGSWKIDAIKKYRAITEAGLKDAKDAVEYMEAVGFEKWMMKIWVPYRCDYPNLYERLQTKIENIEELLKRGW